MNREINGVGYTLKATTRNRFGDRYAIRRNDEIIHLFYNYERAVNFFKSLDENSPEWHLIGAKAVREREELANLTQTP